MVLIQSLIILKHNKINSNKIKQNYNIEDLQDKTSEQKESKNRHNNQRLTHCHAQESHKTIKLEATIYTQKTWYKPVQSL